MDIYNLLRFLITATNPTVESPQILRTYELAKKAAYDLIDELENLNAFGTIAAVTKGDPYR